jgi:hypothetical protein
VSDLQIHEAATHLCTVTYDAGPKGSVKYPWRARCADCGRQVGSSATSAGAWAVANDHQEHVGQIPAQSVDVDIWISDEGFDAVSVDRHFLERVIFMAIERMGKDWERGPNDSWGGTVQVLAELYLPARGFLEGFGHIDERLLGRYREIARSAAIGHNA